LVSQTPSSTVTVTGTNAKELGGRGRNFLSGTWTGPYIDSTRPLGVGLKRDIGGESGSTSLSWGLRGTGRSETGVARFSGRRGGEPVALGGVSVTAYQLGSNRQREVAYE
jgi:hypothetical protein